MRCFWEHNIGFCCLIAIDSAVVGIYRLAGRSMSDCSRFSTCFVSTKCAVTALEVVLTALIPNHAGNVPVLFWTDTLTNVLCRTATTV